MTLPLGLRRSAFTCKEERCQSWPQDMRAAVYSLARATTAYQHQLAAAQDAEILRSSTFQ
jgi:hypothetical protein